ncbi:hypothetical protein SLA2020_323530 [Shorea laevis]
MAATKKLSSLYPLLSLLCFMSIFFLLSLSRRASISSTQQHSPSFQITTSSSYNVDNLGSGSECDYSRGSWIYDPDVRFERYDSSCKEIFKGWNCGLNNKSNAQEIVKWRWTPRNCPLPQLDLLWFLETYKDTNIGILLLGFCLVFGKIEKISCVSL